jgi:pilus assembly protein CpaB
LAALIALALRFRREKGLEFMNKVQIAALGATVIAFGGAYVLFNNSSGPTPAPHVVQAPKLDVDEVLVAAQDIPMGTPIGDGSVAWQEWPKPAISELMIAKSSGPNVMDDVKGSLARDAFLRGEPMRRDKLVKGGAGGFMSAILPTGMRAVAIKIDNSGDLSAGGFILPNDRVDVVKVFRDEEATRARGTEVISTQTILTNVRVLAIGQTVQEKGGEKTVVGANATLELDPGQSELIVLAQRTAGAGNLHLTLRSMLDSSGKTDSVADLGTGKAGGMTIVRAGSPQQATR